jgi:hypothetical protein
MAASHYQSVLELAESLSPTEQLRLVQELIARASEESASVLELRGLGAELWEQIDGQAYVESERSSSAG